jgi:hypothetical protein
MALLFSHNLITCTLSNDEIFHYISLPRRSRWVNPIWYPPRPRFHFLLQFYDDILIQNPLVPTAIREDYSILTSDNSPREHLSIYWRVAWVSSSGTRTFLCSMVDSITSILQMDDVTRSLLLPSASYLPPVSQGSLHITSLLSCGRCGGDTISVIDQRGNHSLFLLGLIS